jgi:hypothetical protein
MEDAREQARESRAGGSRAAEPLLIQVVMIPEIQGPFREWLTSRGLYLYPIPVEGDNLPVFGIGIS